MVQSPRNDNSDSDAETLLAADNGRCPTPTAHKRLHEAHKWWHGCLDSYDQPRDFQANLNACLQALRNVTFALQKEKGLIAGFDEWYPVWQLRMREDALMKWLVNSRNRVVKAGDLELLSKAQIRVVRSYFEIADRLELGEDVTAHTKAPERPEDARTVPPWTPPPEYLKYLASIPRRQLEQSSLLVERRWVDKALPNRELLDALAHCYGVLASLLEDAHARVDVPFVTVRSSAKGDEIGDPSAQYSGRLPCMVVTADVRTTHYRVTDGTLVSDDFTYRSTGAITHSQSRRRYKSDLRDLLEAARPRTALDFVEPIFTQAKAVLKKDRYHSHIVMLLRGGEVLDVSQVVLPHRQAKFLFAEKLAKAVLMTGADGVLTIGELWQSKLTFDEEGVIIPPADVPDRQEILDIYAEISDGQNRHKSVSFTKRFGRIIFGEEMTADNANVENNIMSPTRAIWNSRSVEREQQQGKVILDKYRAGES